MFKDCIPKDTGNTIWIYTKAQKDFLFGFYI